MFESLITQVLNKVLGDFIENVDPNQLNISIMNGDVKLTNMKLKASLFDSMPLPFALKFGQLGTMQLKIPVWNMFNQPLVIEITDLFALITPKPLTDWREEVEVKAYQSANQSRLEQYEVFSQSADQLTQKDPSTVDKLIAKIIDNI
jgi:vacuolar protein sorting-associated protein 13A/C